jgi:2-polyprenyl-3-methyl-5-hydroxy-6-metoxy-1,4-benzoquinol methylase
MGYLYNDLFRQDIYRMIPSDGLVIGVVGCGPANTEARLVKEGRQVHGVDVSREAIEVAATRLTSARVVSSNETSPFEPHSLDGLILADVMEHIPSAWTVLKDYVQMVRPGGWVVISVPNMRYIEALWVFVFGGDWPEHPLGIFDETHLQVMTHKRLARWCQSAGLSLEREYDCYHPGRRIYPLLDRLTFRVFKSLFNFEIQARYRVGDLSVQDTGPRT